MREFEFASSSCPPTPRFGACSLARRVPSPSPCVSCASASSTNTLFASPWTTLPSYRRFLTRLLIVRPPLFLFFCLSSALIAGNVSADGRFVSLRYSASSGIEGDFTFESRPPPSPSSPSPSADPLLDVPSLIDSPSVSEIPGIDSPSGLGGNSSGATGLSVVAFPTLIHPGDIQPSVDPGLAWWIWIVIGIGAFPCFLD